MLSNCRVIENGKIGKDMEEGRRGLLELLYRTEEDKKKLNHHSVFFK